ncbi:MAG: PEGA domain-containing protein [Acidobacteriia bacterium]|nr:PEGA domain-containing protein [Terriglobia bacterium]
MKTLFTLIVAAVLSIPLFAQTSLILSDAEVQQALQGEGEKRWVKLTDYAGSFARSMATGNGNTAQDPAIFIFTSESLLAIRARSAKKQYAEYRPSYEDTVKGLTIVAHGFANGTSSGPLCTTITRVVLLSDDSGKAVAEAHSSEGREESWQNGFGAQAHCQSLRTKFLMPDVQRVMHAADKSEFLVAVFSGTVKTKAYRVKAKHLDALGLKLEDYAEAPKPAPNRDEANKLLTGAKENSEAAKSSPAAAAALAQDGRVLTPQELADEAKAGRASRCAVVTMPPGAEVFVDGNKIGVSPVAFFLRKRDAPRTITVKLEGYKTVEKQFDPDGKIIPLGLTLEKQ